jgi:predicted O-linked N-acetylglucosamine transferase (SPINDLY family)
LQTAKARAPFTQWQSGAPPGKLRVGWVSGDMRNHPVGYFLESLLTHLDTSRFDLVAYPTLPLQDELTARLKPRFAAWRPLFALGDEAAAGLIQADGIDVLLDLSGHTANNRLPVFAWRPAPVQASWLGYFATTGVAEMDYLIADAAGVPQASRGHFSEDVWQLPGTRLCFSPPHPAPAVSALPALANGGITFGCFQNMGKVNDAVLSLWASVLAGVPGARLRWQSGQLADAAWRGCGRAWAGTALTRRASAFMAKPRGRPTWRRTQRLTWCLTPFPIPAAPPPVKPSTWACPR